MSDSKFNKRALSLTFIVVLLIGAFVILGLSDDKGSVTPTDLASNGEVATPDSTEVASLSEPDNAEQEAVVEEAHAADCDHCLALKTSADAEPILSTKPELDYIFKNLSAYKDRIIPKATFDFLKGSRIGDKASLQIAGQDYEGRVSVVRENHALARTYGVALQDELGALLVTSDAGGYMRGHLMFVGDSRAITFEEVKFRNEGQHEPSLVFYENKISDIFCASPDAVYNGSGASSPTQSGFGQAAVPGTSAAITSIGDIVVPSLQSIPDAEFVMYLDFDGEEVTNTPWNLTDFYDDGADVESILALPLARADEAEWVELVWRRVVEDFAPFEINITTDRAVYDAAAIDQRLHVVITLTNTAAVGAGGVAFLHSFREDSPVVWAFNSDEGLCASTISHEAGHALGLSHDGLTIPETEYYGGHNSGYTPGWAPIMGAFFADGTNDEVDQWSRGQYSSANNLEDDIAIIGDDTDPQLGVNAEEYAEQLGVNEFGVRYYDILFPNGVGISNGFGFKADDVADTISGATDLAVTGEDLVGGAGLIGTSDDVDVFRFIAPEGDLGFNVSSLDVNSVYTEDGSEASGANLAVDIELLDASGVVIATGEDIGDNELSSALRTFVTAGTYYLRVSGGARGDNPSVGFSDYSSLGEYSIVGQLDLPPMVVYGGDKQTETVFDGDLGVSTDNGTDFGFSTPSASVTNVFLLENVGTILEIDNITVSLLSGTDFEIGTPLPTGPISPQGAKELIITYNPTTTGVHEDTVIIEYEGAEEEVYQFTVRGIATISATEDNYEDNNISPDAYDLNAYEDVWLSNIEGPAFFLSDAVDFYTFTSAPGDGFVSIDFGLYELGNVKFELYLLNNNVPTLLQTSFATSGSLLYIIPDTFGGAAVQFFIKVTTLDDASVRNQYELKWSSIPLAIGDDDFYEDNDSLEEAFDLDSNPGSNLSDYLRLAILSDDDWYKITIPENPFDRMLYISAVFEHAQGNIDIEVIRDGLLVGSSETTDDNELLTIHELIDLNDVTTDFSPTNNVFVMGVQPGTYYIHVYGDYAGNSYDLIVETLTDDKYEVGDDDPETENDAQEDAFPLGETIIGKWLSEVDGVGTVASYPENSTAEDFENEADADWYAFSLPAGEIIEEMTLDYDFFDGGIGGSVRFYIYDASGEIVASTDDTSALTGTLTVPSPAALNYWLLVEPTDSRQWLSGYDFKVDFSTEPPFIQDPIEDNYEENDTYNQLFNLSGNEGRWLSSLDGYGTQLDMDWFKITVPSNVAKLEATLFHYTADGDMDLRLSRLNGPILFTANDGGNTETIVWDADSPTLPTAGQYALTVYGENRGNFYNLLWELTYFEDNYEQNDTFAAAYDLTGHERRFLNKLNGTGIQADEDWYRISANADTVELRVDLTFTHADGDIDVALHNASGSIIQRSITTTNNEQISYPNPPVGDYYVRVYYGNAGNEYDMIWSAISQDDLDQVPTDDDLYEEHGEFTNNNSAEQAYVLAEDELRLSSLETGLGIQKNDDWYQIEVPEDNVGLRVECLFTDADGDIDIEIYDPIGFPLAIRDSETDNELFDVRTPVPAGTYLIRVYGVNQGNEYDLYWTAFIDDIYEDNDLSGEAADVELALGGPLVNPTLGDDDWYVFTATGDIPFIRVDLSYQDVNGAIDFQVLDAGFNVIATADSTEDSEFVLLEVTAGTYYVHVYGDYFYNPYDMTISVISDDEFEENDISDDAADITATPDILAVQFDTDWYRFELTEPGTFLSLIASFTHTNGNVDLALYAAGDLVNPLATSETELNNETIRVEGTPGIYYVRVTGDDTNQRYRLIWTVAPDDEYEQNDQIADAFPITGQKDTPIDAIQFDEDWYAIEVEPGNIRIFVDLEFTNAEGDLNLAIYNSDEEEVVSVDTEEDGESIILPIFPFGSVNQTFYIRVAGSGVGSAYQLTWTATREDNFEGEDGNNVIENASDVLLDNEGLRISSTIGYAGAVNDDWYLVPINAGDDGVVIELYYVHAVDNNIEMELFNANGTFLRRSTGDTGVERIHYTGSAGQTYYLRVYGSNAAKPYDLIWNSYSEDNLEIGVWTQRTPNNPPDNDNPTTPRAMWLPDLNVSARDSRDLEFIKLDGLTQLDEDWYLLEMEFGENIFIAQLEFEHARGDIDMALYLREFNPAYDPNVEDSPFYLYTFIDNAVTEQDNERLAIRDLVPGDYLLCVYGYGIDNPKADLGWSFDPLTENYSSIERRTELVDDNGDNFNLSNFDLDENDAYGLANTYSLQWVSSVEDEYDIETVTDGDEEINDTRDLSAVPILVDQFGDTDVDNVIDDIERIRNVTNGDGEMVEISYPTVFTYSSLAQFDDDWYKFDVNTQGIFYAAIFFNSRHGDLRMYVYDSNGDVLIPDGSVAVRIDNFGLNTYYIQVVGNDLGVPYSLELTGAEDDYFEENDDLADAEINADITNLHGSPDLINIFIQRDVDLYRVVVPEHQVHLTASVDSDLDLEILDSNGNVLPGGYEQSGGSTNFDYYTYGVISPEEQVYYLKVTGNNFGSPYSLFWDYDAFDEYEPNDDPLLVTSWTSNSNLSRYRLGIPWVNGNARTWNYQDPIQELAFDYTLLSSLELGSPYTDPFGHAIQESDDWYAMQIPSWKEDSARKGNDSVAVIKRLYYTRLSAEIEFTHTDGDINMEIWEDDPDTLGAYRLLARAETVRDIEQLNVAIDPLDEDRFYYVRVYGDDAGNDYSFKWDFTAEDAYERLEDTNLGNDQNSFVDRAFDLTNANGNSTEGTWLHEIEYLLDVDGDKDFDAQDGGLTTRLGYGEQTNTDDWYAVVVSDGATQIEVECIAFSDNDTNYTYAADNLDIDFEVYYLSGNDDNPDTIDLRKPVLIGRSDSDTDNSLFVGTGDEKNQLSADITTGISEGPATFDVVEPGIYFIRIYYDNRNHPYTLKWDDIGDTDNSGDAAIISDYLFGNWSLDLTDSTLPELLQLPFANADGDRWPNWGEFALGLDAKVYDFAVLANDVVEVGGVDYYQFSYLRHKDAKSMGYVFLVEESEDLVFEGTEPVFVGVEDVDETIERVTFQSTDPVSDREKCFFRLSVQPPETFE